MIEKTANHLENIVSTFYAKKFFLITIPPLIWNGFIGLDKSESIVANCASLPHDEKEMVRRKHDDKYFKYDWKV